VKSLDPRVNRLPNISEPAVHTKGPLDQFGTFEVFVEPKTGKPFQHEGAVHAPNLEMAFVLAKETFTRRFTCSALWVVDTREVFVSPITEGSVSVFSLSDQVPASLEEERQDYEIFLLFKRGKQHLHGGVVEATSPVEAMKQASDQFQSDKVVFNIWAIPSASIRKTSDEERDLWITLPEKKFRDASDYKGGDKLKAFIERTKSQEQA
jgi:ring-1,2-phenylacetyl-CoA epoxidase subunit PaaB